MKPPRSYHDATASHVFIDARADARNTSRDALHAFAGTFAIIADDPEADPFERLNAGERLRAFSQEIADRDRVDRITKGAATRFDDDYEEWLDLAKGVKERVEVPDILQLAGLPMRRAGVSRGRVEWCGPCPVCGEGDDRLRAWDGPNGTLWCRRCRWSTDVIGAASLIIPNHHFRDCVRFLAEYAALVVIDGH